MSKKPQPTMIGDAPWCTSLCSYFTKVDDGSCDGRCGLQPGKRTTVLTHCHPAKHVFGLEQRIAELEAENKMLRRLLPGGKKRNSADNIIF